MEKQLLQAALIHFEALKKRAEVNLNIYLLNPVGVGEHPDLVEEIVKLTKEITEAEESIKYLEKFLLEKVG